jgi:secreted trypsin-like serine protease
MRGHGRQRALSSTLTASLAVALAALALMSAAPRAGAVIGGTPAAAGDWPFMAALLDAREPRAAAAQFCGGALVRPGWVLTAAHCVETPAGGIVRARALHVAAGRADLEAVTPAERIPVAQVVRYPLRRADGVIARGHDLALLRLVRPAATSLRVAGAGASRAGAIAGFGAADRAARANSPRLRSGRVSLIPSGRCRALGGAWDTICATAPDSREAAACFGDSGGPLVAGGAVIGLVSTSSGLCARGATAAYTDLRVYGAWINSVVDGRDPAKTLARVRGMRLAGRGAIG